MAPGLQPFAPAELVPASGLARTDPRIATNDDGTVEVASDRDTGPGMGCTDDYNPYRMVVTVDRDRLPNADELPAELDGVPRGGARTWP